MTVKIKKIKYLIPPRDIFNDALDVFVSLEDDYCTDDFCYFVEYKITYHTMYLSVVFNRT